MSLLPKSRQITDAIPMTLGALVREAIAPKVDPILAFETGDHQNRPGGSAGRPRIVVKSLPKTFFENLAEAKPLSTPSAKFKVGDRVRAIRSGEEVCAGFNVGDEGVIEIHNSDEDMRVRFEAGAWWCGSEAGYEFVELLIPPEPKAEDGWIEHKIGAQCPIPCAAAGTFELKYGDGSTLTTISIDAGMCYGWNDSIVAYRVIA